MDIKLSTPSNSVFSAKIHITGSKSETNRLLLLQALFPNLILNNLSNSDDARVMKKGLESDSGVVDIHHAGTAMRFLTSYFASKEGCVVELTGSSRMKERPIRILVEALKTLGAEIEYKEQQGYPPLMIKGKTLSLAEVSLPADVSSQYISSLCLIAPSLPHGLKINLTGKITSIPYLKMTISLLNNLGIDASLDENTIMVKPTGIIKSQTVVVESDWSSASYWYSIVALSSPGTEVQIQAYKEDSLQGDSVLQEIYNFFGVSSSFEGHLLTLKKEKSAAKGLLELDLANAPDIAQTIAVTCLGLGIGCCLTGLHTLPIKETDRLVAMKMELEKFGAQVAIDEKSLTLEPSSSLNADVAVDTYNDHRMAMAFAPLALKTSLVINDAGVVSKSYPDFWEDLKHAGLEIQVI